jgi:serine/threonine protein kinase
MIGKTISHYKILDSLGEGGIGVVYKAQDLRLDRFVAVKFLLPRFSREEETKQRFIREAKAASALDHPNIGTIYEIDETEDGQMFIAMAYYEGGSLREKVKRGTVPVEEAVDMAIQIAQGLAKAHEHGIIHRDIKPANVMLTNDGVAKIIDFGLAKLADATRLTKTGATLGTPAYMSPEQAGMIEVDHRTDIWSLGVVLYEMLTSRLPFHGKDEVTIRYAILNEESESIQKYRPDAPPDLVHILNRALKKTLDGRYRFASDMLRDLRDLQESRKPIYEGKETVTIVPEEAGERNRVIVLSEEALRAVKGSSLTFAEKLRFLNELMLSSEDQPEPPPGNNPYLNRLMIQNPHDFYGRTTELTRIYERIKAVRPQSISLVGVRRIGKSSLLKALHASGNRRKHLPHPEEYVFVFMDFQEKRNVEPAALFQHIFQALENEYRGYLKLSVNPDYDGLKEVVRTLQDCGLKLIFLWDEFECVTRNQKVGPEFYAYFRALANNFNVAYITSSAGQLQSLCHAKEISDSPFFNIFTNLRLSVFKPEEARQLIVEPSAKAGKPLAPHVDLVVDIAGHFPFFIQIACSALFSLPQSEKLDYKKAKEIFMEEARPHFQEYWERFDESQKAVVVALAKGKRPPREHAFAVKDLAQAGFVQNGKLFSSLFAEFVREAVRKNKPWWKIW